MLEFFILPTQLDFNISEILLVLFGLMLCFVCVKSIKSNNLLNSVILLSLFSVLISICYLLMDAPDVAMTEVALGACFSTCVLLNVAQTCGEDSIKASKGKKTAALLICAIFAAVILYACLEFASYGDDSTALHQHLSNHYIKNTKKDIAIPSIVAAILASYRGFDTLGETAVILIAGIGVMLILGKRGKKNA